jgi:hypothetical protein
MNTFATLLLAFPFYLAISGRLTAYTALVNASATAAATPATGMQALANVSGQANANVVQPIGTSGEMISP